MPPEVHVATYNTHWSGSGREFDCFITDMSEALKAAGTSDPPDVICLQEVWVPKGQQLPRAVTLLETLFQVDSLVLTDRARLAGFAVVEDRAAATGTWGLVTLSRVAPRYAMSVPLGSVRADPIVRSALVTTVPIQHRDGSRGTALIANTHATHRVFHAPRQVRALMQRLERQAMPFLIVGDFNSPQGLLRAMRLRRTPLASATWPTGHPMLQLDGVLGSQHWSISERVLDIALSDHRPVVACCELREPLSFNAGEDHGLNPYGKSQGPVE
jgi:endonuclease/exonuclease/phosphatase family metal-dependent hydrolase